MRAAVTISQRYSRKDVRPWLHHVVIVFFGSKASSSPASFQVTGPTTKLKSWESGAKLVKNTQTDNQYLEHIREIHDPSQHIKTIEDELKGTIGKALGKQGEKVNMYLRAMEQERKTYERLTEEEERDHTDPQVIATVEKYNSYRKDATQARWELIVHRQAVGFTVGNHSFVMSQFPIGDPLPTDTPLDSFSEQEKNKKKLEAKKKFGDQLEWWQKVGRWR